MLIDILIIVVKIGIVLGAVLTLAGILTWVERKQSAVIQDRIGANRASIFGIRIIGLFHILADAIKMITKEDFIPKDANKILHTLAPFLTIFPTLLCFAVIPFGNTLNIFGKEIDLVVVDLNIGVIFILALFSLGIYGVVLAGWSSNNKYTLLGGMRASAQMISYEIVMGLSIIGILMIYNSLNLSEIVKEQGRYLFGIPKWGILVQPLAFIIFLTAAIAQTERIPFDLPEGESEIIGYNLEYSGMKFGIFMFNDFIKTILAACLITTLFFGGWQVPYLTKIGFQFPWGQTFTLPHLVVVGLQVASFSVKVFFFCFFLLMVRWTLPRFRYDQLMSLGWKNLLPLSLLNILLTGGLLLLR